MKIERPLSSTEDLVIVYDLIDPLRLDILTKQYVSSMYYDYPEMTDELRSGLEYVPPKDDRYFYEDVAAVVLEEIKTKTKQIMESEFDGFKVERFQDFGKPGLRGPGSSMKPHIDGPPEFEELGYPEMGVSNIGSNYYLNDNYSGGELYYPNLDFEYKPVPNSLVLHRGSDPQFQHGVREVTAGWRLGLGMFGFEHYDLPPLDKGIDSDK